MADDLGRFEDLDYPKKRGPAETMRMGMEQTSDYYGVDKAEAGRYFQERGKDEFTPSFLGGGMTAIEAGGQVMGMLPAGKMVAPLRPLVVRLLNKYPQHEEDILALFSQAFVTAEATATANRADIGIRATANLAGKAYRAHQERAGTMGPEIVGQPDVEKARGILMKNRDKNFVKRVLRPEKSPQWKFKDEEGRDAVATHKMAWGEEDGKFYVYPTMVEKHKGTLTALEGKEAWEYAKKSGERIEFSSAEEAEWFSKNYKRAGKEIKGKEKPNAEARPTTQDIQLMGSDTEVRPKTGRTEYHIREEESPRMRGEASPQVLPHRRGQAGDIVGTMSDEALEQIVGKLGTESYEKGSAGVGSRADLGKKMDRLLGAVLRERKLRTKSGARKDFRGPYWWQYRDAEHSRRNVRELGV